MKKILIIGANGQLAFDLIKVLDNYDIIKATRDNCDITNYDFCESFIKKHKPDIVINTAAYHNTTKCEENPDIAFNVNAVGALNCAKAANLVDATIVFMSSDYIFDGSKKGFRETDKPNPLNVYGASKLAGEHLTKIVNDKYYIIRTTGLYGEKISGKGHSFVSLMLEKAKTQEVIEVVNDQYCSPTYSLDLSLKIKELLDNNHSYGTYHFTNKGFISWYQFAKKIFQIKKMKIKVIPIPTDPGKDSIKRPKYSVLVGSSVMRRWDQALSEFLSSNNPPFRYLHKTHK